MGLFCTDVLAGRRPRPLSALLAASVFVVLMTLAWLMAVAPGEGTDEPAHYVKAVGTGNGELRGDPFRVTAEERRRFLEAAGAAENTGPTGSLGVTAENLTWQARTTREFTLPAGLGFSAFGCASARPERSAVCLERGRPTNRQTQGDSYYGTYQPYVYVPTGIAMQAAGGPLSAMRIGRTVNALMCVLLILAAAVLLGGAGGGLALLGLFAALTPAVLFFSATLTPSGPEIAAGLCFAAALLRLRAEDPPAPGWVWGAATAGGVILGFSRSLGPLFVVLMLIAIALLPAPTSVGAVLRPSRRPALLSGAAIALAVVACGAWELAYQEHPGSSAGEWLDELGPSIAQLPILAKEYVGVFGALDTRMPLLPYAAWGLMMLVLLALALFLGGGRERLALILLGMALVVVAIGLSLGFRQTGYQLQTRHVLPIAVLLPLYAGLVVSGHRARISSGAARALLVAFGTLAAGIHLFAWYYTARRFAVGTDGPWTFMSEAQWAPPGGWWLWLAVALVGTTACVGAGATAARGLRARGGS